MALMRLLLLAVMLNGQWSMVNGQIQIGGNVYGGGNKGNVNGSATVTMRSGDVKKVFGGARQANVGGNAYVNIDGKHASGYMVIDYVFGGNDISGTIGTAKAVGEPLPAELVGNKDGVDDTWNTYVHLSSKTDAYGNAASDNQKVFIGQAFAGGNGDYTYTDDNDQPLKDDDGNYIVKEGDETVATSDKAFTLPDLDKTYIDVQGGTIAFAHGGGNNVTVKEKAVIRVDNPSEVVTHVFVDKSTWLEDKTATKETDDVKDLLNDDRIKNDMGIKMAQEHIGSSDFQIGRFFGGNNKADMSIMPTWHLQSGKIRNLYSGGNKGAMTCPAGLLLEIDPEVPDDVTDYAAQQAIKNKLIIDNVYGGCRMADVRPTVNDVYTPCKNLTLANYPDVGLTKDYNFPTELSARVLVRGGDVRNVFGGNDVTGTVYGGNAVGIYTTIRGNVYGGGNGAYAYTDNEDMKDDDTWGDFSYSDFMAQHGGTSYEALNAFRPNAEQVSIRLAGTSAAHPTIIKGSVFVGGNCASLDTKKPNPMVELKIGSHVIADKVFLGNNGEDMISEETLKLYANEGGLTFSSLNLGDPSVFSSYMDGVAMSLKPQVVFDSESKGDPATYIDYSSKIGSFFCGGNVGSMTYADCNTINFNKKVVIFDKLVGGSNNANVPASDYNAAYEGGITGSPDATTGNKLVLNLSELKLMPMRWKVERNDEDYNEKLTDANDDYIYTPDANGNSQLEWNIISANTRKEINPDNYPSKYYLDRRLVGGNVYGGCCESGYVNGNVVVNIDGTIVDRNGTYGVFATATPTSGDPDILYDHEDYTVSECRSGVILDEQGMDVLGEALTVYGGGKGKGTEIWGSSTVNINHGYSFQVFGGSESGVIGKYTAKATDPNVIDGTYNATTRTYTFNGKIYQYTPAYSTYVNLKGIESGSPRTGEDNSDTPDVEFIYGGSFEGPIIGNTEVHLDNGRLFNLFAGSCNADILGHTETYVGLNGFPYLRDHIYGGNDLGGKILGVGNFTSHVREGAIGMVHAADIENGTDTGTRDGVKDVLQANSYVEYRKGHTRSIFGGCFGDYDYNKEFKGYSVPSLHNAFVNIRPDKYSGNQIEKVFGAGEGAPGIRQGDRSQDRSYVLIDIDDDQDNFASTEVFGSGSNNGLGMRYTPTATFEDNFGERATAVIDLLHGKINTAYGGSYNEGITRRTLINVPAQSTIKLQNIFGGAYGTQILPPCDVYESNVNYSNTGEQARVTGSIYGGNNNERRTLYTHVNISSPVWQDKDNGYTATIYGAGRGIDTWSEYSEVNLESGARVYKVFGGGEMGHVLNAKSVQKYMWLYRNGPSPQISAQDPNWNERYESWTKAWEDAWTLGDYFKPNTTDWNTYAANANTNESRVKPRSELDDKTAGQLAGAKKYNTHVIIRVGATVDGYAYGGGFGNKSSERTGDVYGTTYIALLGGTVSKDIYAAGQAGGLDNLFGAEDFTASSNAYILGGSVRNVYGGGYEGHVGYHVGDITTESDDDPDRPAESYVVIGKVGTNTYAGGAPAIQRNAYGGGEGGSVYGSSKLTLNNGYIGYRYKNTGTTTSPKYEYVPELDDQKPGDLDQSGNIFGGGYVINSYVDNTTINLYGGTVRGSVYGGGEVGPIGRGTMRAGSYTNSFKNGDAYIFKGGKTQINMYDGHVLRNVFGGGRGHDNWGGDGTKYMDPALVATLDMKPKGYVFGQTEVNIYGGEVGTDEGMLLGFGNVFGGGDEGSVYSGTGVKSGKRYDGDKEGYYYNNGKYTEDCKVLIEPHCYSTAPTMKIGTTTYKAGDYVPTSALNTLKDKTDDAAYWDNLDADGIIIHNAVFAGGNIAAGSTSVNANETTVFGNATASIHDVYNRDLITIGTGHTGGLYGDGNLTFVDGYRELNITNYGTDYYHIDRELSYDDYTNLAVREQAYYELKYKCLVACSDIEGTSYSVNAELPLDELLALFLKEDGKSLMSGSDSIIVTVAGKKVPNEKIWKANGVVTNYAGRIMNTIQRADFCGVFGSRMVMKGARDRVPEEVDYTNYTINRVREVSLNKVDSKAGDTDPDNILHGNYFGIYNTVNFLGALTSDVDFHSVRTTNANISNDPTLAADESTTFYDWKSANISNKKRNNGTCHNHLALASGVSLELTTEKSTGKSLNEKDWGLITGVVELDLINVQPGIGGGFVYAKNQHGVPTKQTDANTTLTILNTGAVTQKGYTYSTTEDNTNQKEWETSGNFIHSSQTILDDCYNITNKYMGTDKVPAHYWYIAGSVYVYDQYISAYTGSSNAFSQTAELPITIAAAAHGTMTLMDVRPSLYAYYSSYTSNTQNVKLGTDQKMVIGDVTYQLNDPINFWDWNKLTAAEKKRFVAETYVLKDSCKIGNNFYPAGYVMLPDEYTRLSGNATKVDLTPTDGVDNEVPAVLKATIDADGNSVVVKDNDGHDVYIAVDDAFRSSNNMSHDTGYLLTYEVTNPAVWGQWFTKIDSSTGEKQLNDASGYEDAPTYRLKSSITGGKVLGQREYTVSEIIPKKVYDDYAGLGTNKPTEKQATFVPAYIVTSEYMSADKHYYPGAAVSAAISGYTAPAFVCTSTIKLSDTEYIYVNELMTEEQKENLKTKYSALSSEIDDLIVPAYYCTVAGLYGGDYYESGKNYRALAAWSAMSEDDRENFEFNYDALDLLIDPAYGKKADGTQQTQGQKYQYDSKAATLAGAQANDAHYSLATPIDYTATYHGTTDETAHNGVTLTNGIEYSRENYEKLPNEQRHYAAINVTEAGDYYVVNTDFIHVETPYTVGTTLSSEAYGNLTTEEKAHITTLTFTADQVKTDNSGKTIPYYYCREEYKIGENTEGVEPTPLTITGATGGGIETRDQAQWVKVGTIIAGNSSGTDVGYESLKNYQKNFTIHGKSPMETSTLYVSRNSDIDDLRKEKVITVIYKYDYEESDADGMHITPVSERHVVNIHIKFESGVPTIPDIQEPDIVLPGTSVIIRAPLPTPGAYEITGGGWELYEKPSDAESHTNGVPYTPSVTPLYWYQDEFYLAYYAKTMLGKTYSNHVPVHVANYHDLKKVMDDKENHLHIDYDRTRLKRDSKIYINDYSESSENGLDLFKDLYDLSLMTTAPATGTRLEGHALLNNSEDTGINKYDEKTYKKGVKAGNNLDFFLRTDIDHGPTPDPDHEGQTISHPWTPIASGVNEPCFQGTLHGDGHTISGLAPADGTTGSLFGRLCGSVYNLGVRGSFTGAGVADTGDGYVESCWVKTTGTPVAGTKAVFGDPTATSGQQVVNCYYPESNSGYSTGNAIQKPDRAFYNGELAYDLNNFYLYKRYSDKMVAAGDGKVRYRYFTVGTDNKLVLEEDYKYYESHPDLCSSGYIDNEHIGLAYVEDRFDDGDFRYAAGEIPTTEDERFHLETVTGEGGKTTTEPHFYPIWPDDYIFFGQKLTYGYSATQPHQDVPTAVVRENGRLATSELANRVYRAPAYYRSKQMGVTHFNPTAYLAAKSADGTQVAYPGMTAIDFAGHNGTNEFTGTYGLGTVSSLFYPPLLDDDGLLSITNCDETKNLLVYAPAETAESGYANKATYDVLNAYFTEPAYTDFYDNNNGYRLVGDAMGEDVNGHLVQNSLKATNDHLLVDRQDFNAPIGYSLDGSRMWYQRKPADNEFVDRTKGWQGISLPFTAELVTTNQKGEITHFYSGSKSSENGTGKKIGHEYWLRKYAGITTEGSVSTADFTYPSSSDGSAVMNKKDDDAVTNTFLWKYYYEKFSRQDENSDTYQDYYSNARTYNNYPLATANKPYLLGLPGLTYYEFDLSGKFIPQHTAGDIDKLEKQVVTFASKPNISIEVSDDKTAGVTFGNYTFKPNYLNNPELAANYHAFLLNDDGDRYIEDMTATTAEVTAFRPYFTAPAVRGSREGTRSIVFSNNGDNLSHETYEVQDPGSLSIFAAKQKIVVTSTLKYTTDVRIVNTAGQVLDKFAIKPGETIETRINNAGVYIVQDEEGKYIKKLAVE